MAPQLPQCNDCSDNIPHAVAGYCLVADGSPVLVVTTVDCDTGIVTTQLVDPSTGNAVPTQPVQSCASSSLDLESLDTVDCDDNPLVVDAIPIVHQGVQSVKLCDNTILSIKDAEVENLSHQKVVVPASPATIGLIPPVNADFALIENFFSSNRAVRWRGDGTLPIGGGDLGSGHWLTAGTTIEYHGDLTQLLFTKDQVGGTATLEISYYRYI